MNYNLINEPWLPVLCADGQSRWVRPWEIVEGESPPVALNAVRPDFRAGLMEFLVGLLQTTMESRRPKEWARLLRTPPSQKTLREAFEKHEQYFNLLGDRPRFMQDLTMCEADNPVSNDVSGLFPELPTGKTITTNTDLFVMRGQVENLCPACAAAALFTLQAFAPAGGRGNRTSMRGGGPLSTLVMGKTLWESLWLNVIPGYSGKKGLDSLDEKAMSTQVYAWAAPTRASNKNELVHPEDMHPLHAFWGMPRRIVLKEETDDTPCDLCGRTHAYSIKTFWSRPYGFNYGDSWEHPLTPYTKEQDKPPLSIKGRSNIGAYLNWLGVIVGEPDKRAMTPARCVSSARANGVMDSAQGGLRIHVAGFDMDNAKVRSWCEHAFPVFPIRGDLDSFAHDVRAMVRAADEIRRLLTGCLKDALVHEAGKNQAKIDSKLFTCAGSTFWTRTEDRFYDSVSRLAEESENRSELRATVWIDWGRHLLNVGVALFEEIAGSFEYPAERIRRYVEALDAFKGIGITKLRKQGMFPPKEGK